MQIATLKLNVISAWAMALVYDWIEKTTGMELDVLLYGAVMLLAIGLFIGCRENKETKKEEA